VRLKEQLTLQHVIYAASFATEVIVWRMMTSW